MAEKWTQIKANLHRLLTRIEYGVPRILILRLFGFAQDRLHRRREPKDARDESEKSGFTYVVKPYIVSHTVCDRILVEVREMMNARKSAMIKTKMKETIHALDNEANGGIMRGILICYLYNLKTRRLI